MGKKQHQKDKLYITTKEWKEERGGCKKKETPKYFRLPFEVCCLSFRPYTDPCCNKSGYLFDILNLTAFIDKYRKDPVSGENMTTKDIIKLKMFLNSEGILFYYFLGKYHCPVTRKVFCDNVHVVAIKTSGNVYAFDALEELNFKLNNYKDLVDDTPFTKKDVITIHDPAKPEKLNVAKFYHVVNNLKHTDDEDDDKEKLRLMNPETLGTLNELEKTYKPPIFSDQKQDKKLNARNAAHYSNGAVAYSLTCTSFLPITTQTPAILDDDIIRYPKIKKKGYVQMITNMGNLNIQLHCDLVPKTCENFLKLCKSGYYTDTVFFRLIPEHIVQGGDPEGTGRGGQSAFGKPLRDEIRANLRHDQFGVLSMANCEKDTNTSQFFFTFNPCPDFDGRYTVFGKAVGGLETLRKIQQVPTDEDFRPLLCVRIVNCNVFTDPFEELDKELLQPSQEIPKFSTSKIDTPVREMKKNNLVGKYLNRKTLDKPKRT